MATSGDGSIILKTKVDQSGLKSGLSGMTGIISKVGTALAAAFAVKKIYDFGKAVVSSYADYEQLVGGVETLFKDSADKVMEYANRAFQTAGMSANEYMQNVTSFSASLISSLGGDTDKAADVANMALVSMSDNANKMGSSLESVTMAFQGFAKGQYMLLDNLKLGYGGTKTEMQRLLKDAEAYLATQGKTAKFSIDNLADVYTAIDAIQQKLGIAGTTMAEAEKTISGSIGMVKASWSNLMTAMAGGGDMDRAVNNFVYSFEKAVANLRPVIERTLMGVGQAIQKTLPMLVETVVVALVQQIPNLVVAVYQMIIGLFKGLVLGIKALFTGGTAKVTKVIEGNINSGATGASTLAENMEDVADATKKAGKEAKKTLASFDEINILNQSSGSSSSDSSDVSVPAISSSGGGGGLLDNMSNFAPEIDAELTAIMAVAGASLLAVGLVLLFFGNIPWGIGLIVAGAVTFGVAVANSAKTGFAQDIINTLTTIMGFVGGALIVLGIILIYFGTAIPTAIGLIVAGAALIVTAVATQGILNPSDIKGWLSLILGIAGGALLALGVILCYFGCIPIGVGMIIAGAVSLVSAFAINTNAITDKIRGWVAVIMAIAGGALLVLGIVLTCSGNLIVGIPLIAVGAVALVTPIALNWNEMVEKISSFFNDCAGLVVGISLALLVLGVVLCCTGVALPLGIGLIVVGAAGLATEVALNWELIKEKVSNGFDAISKWVTTWGILILGIILVLSGVGIPLGIALMIKGGQNLAEAQDPLWNTIVEKVKYVWDTIKAFWNTHISKWFTKEHWKGLGKNIVNGLIEAVEKGLNFIIDKINTLSWDVPDWVPGIGGKTWGFNFSNIKIPRLATGAVIPPNREFLAVLGDQKHGTNIEAPLQTIVDAFNIALAQNGNASGGNTEVVLEIDGREFGRAVVEQGNRENRRIGTRLVIA